MVGIALGVAVLIIVLSVMNGFQKDVRDRMLSVLSHIEIFDTSGTPIHNWKKIASQVSKNKEVIGAAPYIDAQVILARAGALRGVVVRGVLPIEEIKVSEINTKVKQGNFNHLKSGKFNIVLGIELARAFDIHVGDKVTLISPHGQITPIGIIPRLRQFRVVGIFEAGHFEYDSSLAFIHLSDAERIFHQNAPSGIRLKVMDMLEVHRIVRQLSSTLPYNLYLRDWTKQNSNWFTAVKTEKRMMFIILTLIITVATFNLVSTLVMTVNDRRAEIAILRTLGATPMSIMKIFLIHGILVGLIGTIAGTAFGILVAMNIESIVPFIESLLHVHFFLRACI